MNMEPQASKLSPNAKDAKLAAIMELKKLADEMLEAHLKGQEDQPEESKDAPEAVVAKVDVVTPLDKGDDTNAIPDEEHDMTDGAESDEDKFKALLKR